MRPSLQAPEVGGLSMSDNCIHSRAYKRTRKAQLKLGKSDQDAKLLATQAGREAVKAYHAKR